jgi:hypothetical protein
MINIVILKLRKFLFCIWTYSFSNKKSSHRQRNMQQKRLSLDSLFIVFVFENVS